HGRGQAARITGDKLSGALQGLRPSAINRSERTQCVSSVTARLARLHRGGTGLVVSSRPEASTRIRNAHQVPPGSCSRRTQGSGNSRRAVYRPVAAGKSVKAPFSRPLPEIAVVPMTQPPNHPITDSVLEAMTISKRGCDELLPERDWQTKLARSNATGVPLRIKLGLDPTAPDIHIGHTVVLNKMRELQDLGHEVTFLIGDFTSMIGDPSGRNATRPPLTREQIAANAKTYYAQASLVLDPD